MFTSQINKLFLKNTRNFILNKFKYKYFSTITGERKFLLRNDYYNKNDTINCNILYSRIINYDQNRSFSFVPWINSLVNMQSKIFQSISESKPVEYSQDYLNFIHDFTGLSWWGSIILATCLLRTTITVPLALYQNYILAKVENIQIELKNDIIPELKKETAFAIKKFKLNKKQTELIYRRSLKKQWRLLIERENCHPLKATILIWFQIPIWICTSVALRNMIFMQPFNDLDAQIVAKELSLGGVAWFPNLLIPDESLILPVMFGVVNFLIIELQVMSKLKKPSKLQNIFTNFFRMFSLIMIPIAATLPSGLNLYWISSSVFGLMQNVILLSPRIKRIVHIPDSPSQLDKPYKHIAEQIILKTKFLNSKS